MGKNGFTLIEFILVILIVGLLALLAWSQYTKYYNKLKDSNNQERAQSISDDSLNFKPNQAMLNLLRKKYPQYTSNGIECTKNIQGGNYDCIVLIEKDDASKLVTGECVYGDDGFVCAIK